MNQDIPDQRSVWDGKHAAGNHEPIRYLSSSLAKLAEPKFPRHSKILELGCGVGRDAVMFEKKGHSVTATDISKVVVMQNEAKFADSSVEFVVLDMQKPLPYSSETFDVVFANLSLHYYTDRKTREILKEITRVLKNGGLLVFACKSVDDFHYGSGKEIEKDVFVSASGHVRHLFSIPYAKQLLEGNFDTELLEPAEGEYVGEKGHFVYCIARKQDRT